MVSNCLRCQIVRSVKLSVVSVVTVGKGGQPQKNPHFYLPDFKQNISESIRFFTGCMIGMTSILIQISARTDLIIPDCCTNVNSLYEQKYKRASQQPG